MSSYIHKNHNVTVLLYHLVFPAKYRRAVIDPEVDQVLRNICLDIEARYEIKFLEIGTDKDHVHFLVQSVPMYSVKKIVQVIKSITAREVFRRCPQVKTRLWGGDFLPSFSNALLGNLHRLWVTRFGFVAGAPHDRVVTPAGKPPSHYP